MQRVLVLEDDDVVRDACRRSLSRRAKVDEARNLAEARALFVRERYDAAIVDVALPDGNGLELLRWIRERERALPVLVMTGRDDHELAADAFLLGAHFVRKPFDLQVLSHFLDVASRSRPLDELVAELSEAVGLSRRETELVGALTRGVMRHELPDALEVSENTVKTMVRRVLQKTKMSSTDVLVSTLLARSARSGFARDVGENE